MLFGSSPPGFPMVPGDRVGQSTPNGADSSSSPEDSFLRSPADASGFGGRPSSYGSVRGGDPDRGQRSWPGAVQPSAETAAHLRLHFQLIEQLYSTTSRHETAIRELQAASAADVSPALSVRLAILESRAAALHGFLDGVLVMLGILFLLVIALDLLPLGN